MQQTKRIIGLIVIMAVIALIVFVRQTPVKVGDAQTSNVEYFPGTNTAVACGNASSTLLLATSTGVRNFIRISNISPYNVYLALGANAATSSGLWLAASSTWQMSDPNVIYSGSVYCLSQGGSATATVVTLP